MHGDPQEKKGKNKSASGSAWDGVEGRIMKRGRNEAKGGRLKRAGTLRF